MKTLLKIEDLKKHFPVSGAPFARKKTLKANDGVSLTVREGETYAIVGESGCGKSTLGRTVIGLYKPTSGRVIYYPNTENDGRGVELTALSEKQLRAYRGDLQIIFQDPYSSLNPRMTVGQIVGEGVVTQKLYPRRLPALKEYVLSVMERCGLSKDAFLRYPHQFSGGQRQRVCIARALAVKPRFVVCDECVSALDASVQSQILNLLQELKEKEKLTYLFISHDLSVVRHVSDRVAVMYLGNIVETAETERLFSEPLHPYTIALLAAAPSLDGSESREKIILQGALPSPVFPPTGCKFHTRCFMAEERCRLEVPALRETEDGHFVACHFARVNTDGKKRLARRKSREKK